MRKDNESTRLTGRKHYDSEMNDRWRGVSHWLATYGGCTWYNDGKRNDNEKSIGDRVRIFPKAKLWTNTQERTILADLFDREKQITRNNLTKQRGLEGKGQSKNFLMDDAKEHIEIKNGRNKRTQLSILLRNVAVENQK